MLADTPILLTTGQAAKLCSVTPDTVLKWIKRGLLSAFRTAGGHYRIEPRDLEPLVVRARPAEGAPRGVRCWEYLGNQGAMRDDCRECVVYRVRAAKCFLMAGLEADVGHARRFCQTSCEDCVYYRLAKGLSPNVLVITSDDPLVDRLADDEDDSITLRIVRNAYAASAIISDFRPAFAVIDMESMPDQSAELLGSLAADSRVPGWRIIVAVPPPMKGRKHRWPRNDLVVGVIEKPFGRRRVAGVINSFLSDFLDAKGQQSVCHETKGTKMSEEQSPDSDSSLDEDGFLREVSEWNRSMAEVLAEKNDIGPLTEEHWRIIEFVKDYYANYGTGPAVVKIGKKTGLSTDEICTLFPCGVVRGAYRLAGLPRPPGCF